MEYSMHEKYKTSKIDGRTYCFANGSFNKHLREHGLTYRDYYEKFITGVEELCPYCSQPKTFYQKTHTYAQTCGSHECYGKLIRDIKNEFTEEKNKIINEKRRKTTMEKYGVEYAGQMEETKKKTKEKLSRITEDGRTYGDHIQERAYRAKIEKYGFAYNNSEKIRSSKAAHTVERKNEINEKRSRTNLEKYGVESVLLTEAVRRKSLSSNAKIKDYVFPSNRKIGVQGYEPRAINKLLEIYTEDQIMISDAYHITKCNMPVINYKSVNRHNNTYYPDIFIPGENRIVEVKSRWWYDGYGRDKYKSRLENNRRKMKACTNQGYLFEFWIYEVDNTLTVIKE
jgi:hypothetical protein